ncbi:hypothetical protein UK23_10970 [Lentzea aerocolonigenes]|uniref:NADH:flavin oxidoreductase/NADH oxidase N-terminal domain-containing protein n=1 Tax=Lentzea aerocolonigenes TaxID=68170 RepID=A0A0F0H9M4_LENAE|nr:hypothetical protein UK23_10970 [Lentzea aerocolonigenes]
MRCGAVRCGAVPAPVLRALSVAEVREQAQAFGDAARYAIEAGFHGVELYGANGYLIQQFLSSSANLRTDSYGASRGSGGSPTVPT